MAIELVARQDFGGDKPYVARIVGTDPKYGMAREFLPVARDGNKRGTSGTATAIVTEPGLYELGHTSGAGRAPKYVVVAQRDGELVRLAAKAETAIEIATAIDGGRDVADLRIHERDGKPCIRDANGRLVWASAKDARADAIAQIRRLMAEHDLTVADLE